MADEPTSAADAALVVVHSAMSTTGPLRDRNEDHLGWGRVGDTDSGIVVGSLTAMRPVGLIGAAEGAVDVWGPVSGTNAEVAGSGMVFVVADGLGGHGGGDVASHLAIGQLLERFGDVKESGSGGASLLRAGFNAANQRVFDAAVAGEGARRMQTTLTALVILSGEAHIGHVGDSRIYRSRGDMLELLTTDHTQVMEMIRMRLIRADQAADHPARHALTRSLGADITVRTDVRMEPLADGDTFLVCSDGLWSKVDAGEIREALREDPKVACERLVVMAIARGGEDNATAVVVRVERAGMVSDRPRGWRRFLPS